MSLLQLPVRNSISSPIVSTAGDNGMISGDS